jgi:hypothetical protein
VVELARRLRHTPLGPPALAARDQRRAGRARFRGRAHRAAIPGGGDRTHAGGGESTKASDNVIQLFSEKRQRAIGMSYKWTGIPPPPSYCTPGLNALLGRSSSGVVGSHSDGRSAPARPGGTHASGFPGDADLAEGWLLHWRELQSSLQHHCARGSDDHHANQRARIGAGPLA